MEPVVLHALLLVLLAGIVNATKQTKCGCLPRQFTTSVIMSAVWNVDGEVREVERQIRIVYDSVNKREARDFSTVEGKHLFSYVADLKKGTGWFVLPGSKCFVIKTYGYLEDRCLVYKYGKEAESADPTVTTMMMILDNYPGRMTVNMDKRTCYPQETTIITNDESLKVRMQYIMFGRYIDDRDFKPVCTGKPVTAVEIKGADKLKSTDIIKVMFGKT